MPLCFEFDAPPKHNLDAQMMQRKIPCDLRIECGGKIVNIRMMLYYHEIEKRFDLSSIVQKELIPIRLREQFLTHLQICFEESIAEGLEKDAMDRFQFGY